MEADDDAYESRRLDRIRKEKEILYMEVRFTICYIFCFWCNSAELSKYCSVESEGVGSTRTKESA